MTAEKTPALVNTQWLKSSLDRPDIVILDATWYTPDSENDASMEFREAHIPGALFFDIALVSDQQTDLPNMLPPPQQFEEQVSAMGITNSDHVIVYDSIGIFSAPRVWWMFRYFGHDRVSVLDGGLPAWLGQNLPTKGGLGKPKKQGGFKANPRPELLRSFDDMQRNISAKSDQVIDMRSRERYDGITPEPWPSPLKGHIQGSKNWHYKNLLQHNSKIKSIEILKDELTQMGVKLDKPVVTTCGSGISACVGALALYEMGATDVAVYDGSWVEWSKKYKP